MNKYLYIVINNIRVTFSFPPMIWGGAVIQVLSLFLSVEIWKSIYLASSSTVDFPVDKLVNYSILSVCLGSLYTNSILNIIQDKCVTGDIAYLMTKPIDYKPYVFFESIGRGLGRIIIQIPIILILSHFFFGIQSPDILVIIPFVLSLIFGLLIIYELYFLLGMLSFWFQKIDYISVVVGGLFQILGGNGIPLWFFPDAFNKVSNFLPFKYTYYVPISIYQSELFNLQSNVNNIFIQIIWIYLLSTANKFVWSRAVKRIEVNGG